MLVIVIQIGLVLISQLFFIVMAVRHGQLPAGARIAQQLVAFVTNTFIGPIYATGLTLFYYDQRVRKEGYDIEWMMEAAGLTPPAAELAVPAPEPPPAPPPAPNPAHRSRARPCRTRMIQAVLRSPSGPDHSHRVHRLLL